MIYRKKNTSMPKLRFLNRYWHFSGDDFSLPVLWNGGIRTIWVLGLTCFILFSGTSFSSSSSSGNNDPNNISSSLSKALDCETSDLISSYIISSIILMCMSIACEIQIFRISLKGTIVDANPRKNLNFYLFLHIILAFMQFCAAFYGFFIVLSMSIENCNKLYSLSSSSPSLLRTTKT